MKIFSGIQPSGNIHLGNYLGALKQWKEIQDEAECIFCIVDLHAITVPNPSADGPKILKEKILEVAALYIASGIDPQKSTIFVQSSRPEHAELAWILNCNISMGELSRMTQYKDKGGQNPKEILKKAIELTREELGESYWENDPTEHINKKIDELKDSDATAGLFDYPVLMAADILLYQTTDVPVGEDQVQHIEITRDIAERVNKKYGDVFAIPKAMLNKTTTRIMALDDPTKKMSKSAPSPANYIALTDDDETIRNKIKKAVTDSGNEIKSGGDKPAITNLLNIFAGVTGREVAEIEKDFEGKTYGEFKDALAEAIIAELKPVREKFEELIADKENLKKILTDGAQKVAPEAQETLQKVKKVIGLGL